MSKEMGVLKAWGASVRRTQAAKKRANNLSGTMSVAHADDDEYENNNGSGKLYSAERVLPNSDYYTGQWSDNFPHGQGKYLWSDGCMYEGEWFRGKTMGTGRFSWPSGATYEGEFKSGYMDGTGTYTGSNGDTYKGQWIMNLKHGHGVKNYASGDWYEGEWHRGLQEGQGKYQWKNGRYYIGEWKNGEICGKGTFVWTNGNRYDGFWEDRLPKGNGTFRWPDGSFYVGYWSKDPSEQNGTYYTSSSCPEANHEWDPYDVYNVDLGDCKICHGEKVSIFPSQKKLALWSSSKSGDNLNSRRMSADGRVRVGLERPLDRLHVCDGDGDGDGDESGDVGSRIPTVGNLEDDLSGLHINEANPRGLPMTRRAKKQGETIRKGHKNYELMLNLQLGIRYSSY
jgi:1-phosphatidylinositol-4-phosphate 5-kinase